MTREQFQERFLQLSVKDELGLTTLARQVMDDARDVVRAIVGFWLGSNREQERKASLILSDLDDLAFVPITEHGDPIDPRHRVWLLRIAGSSHLEQRAKFIALIERLLEDRRRPDATPMQGPVLEENPPVPRVCDEAYLLHRQLLNFAETPGHYQVNARAFLGLSDHQKDIEIQNLKTSKTWKTLVTPEG